MSDLWITARLPRVFIKMCSVGSAYAKKYEPVQHMARFVFLFDGVFDPKRREADPRRVDADLRRRERRVRRPSTGRSENFFAAATAAAAAAEFFLTESACDRMGPTFRNENRCSQLKVRVAIYRKLTMAHLN